MSAALKSLHAYLRGDPKGLPFKTDVATLQAGLNFTLETDAGDLDILGEEMAWATMRERSPSPKSRELYGLKLRVLSLDGLIAAKKAAARNKDKSHLLELEALKKLRDAGTQGA